MMRQPLARVTAVLLMATLALGAVLGVKSCRPMLWMDLAPMQVVQPLHTLAAFCMLLAGVAALTCAAMRGRGGPGALEQVLAGVTALFALIGGGAIAAGRGSGLEYATWPLWLTPLPIAILVALAVAVSAGLGRLTSISGEGAWLLLMGLVLAPMGLVERWAGALAAASHARDLTVEWHALDTVFAGLNASLYGLAVLMAAPEGKTQPLRPRWMYALAAFAIVSTFGHHHYMSGQPFSLKIIAFVASMLGAVSFARHLAGVWRARGRAGESPAGPFLFAAQAWTLFAVGTGIVLAYPQVNLVLHGTHAIVAHSMGAMIGVNVMIILGGLVREGAAIEPARAARLARWSSVLLALICLDLLAAGVVKGVARMGGGYAAYRDAVRWILLPLAPLGLGLAVTLVRAGALALRRSPVPGVMIEAKGERVPATI